MELASSEVLKLKQEAGVYRLVYLNPNDQKYYIYYVGQAADLKTRLYQHLADNETNNCCSQHLKKYNCYFRAALVSKQADRDGIEVYLYNHFSKPNCVERVPDVDPIEVNLE
jgi:excinuclease UvrABC nuclease subunit